MHNNAPRTIREALSRASYFLSTAKISEPDHIAEYLLRSFLGWDRTNLILQLQSPMDTTTWGDFQQWLNRATAGEPIQYITGQQDFYGESFVVAPGVLIPRPETELLIEHLLRATDDLFADQPIRVIDLGTGSGAIPITLAKQRPHWAIWTIDISPDALKIAKENAMRLGVSNHIKFVQGSMLDIKEALSMGTKDKLVDDFTFDVIVSNPPYIPSMDIPTLQREVRDHEPMIALDGGEDGLTFYRGIVSQLGDWLGSPGIVAFEIGIGQSHDIVQLLTDAGIDRTEVHYDFQNIDRIVLGYKTGTLSI